MDYGHWGIEIVGEFDPSEFFGFIYEIEEIATGKKYIGKKFFKHKRRRTKSDPSRTKESDWREYISSCVPLQEAIEAQGKQAFKFSIILLCSGRSELTYEEIRFQMVHDVLRAKLSNGEPAYFNRNIANKHFGSLDKQTEATRRESLRRAFIGVKLAPEHKESIRLAMNRPEVKERNRQAQNAPGTIENHRLRFLGSKHTSDRIEKNRQAQLIAQNRPEIKERNSQSHLLAMNRPEVREKLRQAGLAYYARKREQTTKEKEQCQSQLPL